jgi:tetratricopeptide (TPR) repeat protein
LTLRGLAEDGLALIKQALTAIGASGALATASTALTKLAETYAVLGQSVKGLECLAEAADIVEATDYRAGEAELYRVRGELLRAMGDESAAEHNFHRALDVSKRQSAKLLELKVAMSLAQLWRDQTKSSEALDLLSPIYGWFTEGFDAPDLVEAKSLLDELALPSQKSVAAATI